MVSNREWLKVGSTVMEYRLDGRYAITTVSRFTKTRVVLENGTWYPLDTLHRSKGDVWTPPTELRPIDDKDVQRAMQNVRLRKALRPLNNVDKTLTAFDREDLRSKTTANLREAAELLITAADHYDQVMKKNEEEDSDAQN
jgi:hypothetical protein